MPASLFNYEDLGPKHFDKEAHNQTTAINKTLLLLLPRIKRTFSLSVLLLAISFLEQLAVSLPENYPLKTGLMPSVHFFLRISNLRHSSGSVVLLINTFVNTAAIASFALLYIYYAQPKQMMVKKISLKICLYIVMVYEPALLIPFLNTSSARIKYESNLIIQLLAAYNIATTILISTSFISIKSNFRFKSNDFLETFSDFNEYLLLFLQILYALIINGEAKINMIVHLMLMLARLLDFAYRVNYINRTISTIYSSFLCFSIFLSVLYNLLILDLINSEGLEISYILFFGGSVIIKLSLLLRPFIIEAKFKNSNVSNLSSAKDITLFVRESVYHLRRCEKDFNSKFKLFNIVIQHLRTCDNIHCDCQSFINEKQDDIKAYKKIVRLILGDLYRVFFKQNRISASQDLFINYCSYCLYVEKIPNKALNLLLKSNKQLLNFKNKASANILAKKCRGYLEKRLSSGNYRENFALVVVYDQKIKMLEHLSSDFLVDYIDFLSLLSSDSKTLVPTDLVWKSAELSAKYIQLKHLIVILLNRNAENLRIVAIAHRIHRLYASDLEFRNFLRRVDIKRGNQISVRKKGEANEDEYVFNMYDPEGGVLFLNLTNDLGRIELMSTNVLSLFNYKREDLEGENIKMLMPKVFALQHDQFLNKFIVSGKTSLLRSSSTVLSGVDRQGFLLNLNVMLRVDTFYSNNFMVGGFLKPINHMSKAILCDKFGNILHFTKGIEALLHLDGFRDKDQNLFNICSIIPDLFWFFFTDLGNIQKVSKKSYLLILPSKGSPSKDVGLFKLKANMVRMMMVFGKGFWKPHNIDATSKRRMLASIYNIMSNAEKFFLCNAELNKISYANDSIELVMINFSELFQMKSERNKARYAKVTLNKFERISQAGSIKKESSYFHTTSLKNRSNMDQSVSSSNDHGNGNDSNTAYFINGLTDLQRSRHLTEIMNDSNLWNLEDCEEELDLVYKVDAYTYEPQTNNNLASSDNPNLTTLPGIRKTKLGIKEKFSEFGEGNFCLPVVEERHDNLLLSHSLFSGERNNQVKADEENLEELYEDEGEDEENKELERSQPNNILEDKRSNNKVPTTYADIEKNKKLSKKGDINSEVLESGEDEDDAKKKIGQTVERSEASSMDSQKGDFSALLDFLTKHQPKEIKSMKCIGYSMFLFLLGFSIFFYIFNSKFVDKIEKDMTNSILIKDIVIPINLLTKNWIIEDFNKKGLFDNQSQKHLNFLNYLNFSIKDTQGDLRKLYRERLSQTDLAILYSTQVKIEFPLENMAQNDGSFLTQNIYFRQILSFFYNFLIELNGPVLPEDTFIYFQNFLLRNYIPFLQFFFNILQENESSVMSDISLVHVFNIYFILIVCCTYALALIFVFNFVLRIKVQTVNFASYFRRFPAKEMQDRIMKVVHYSSFLFPKLKSLLKSEIAIGSKSSKGKYMKIEIQKEKLTNEEKGSSLNMKKKSKPFSLTETLRKTPLRKFLLLFSFFLSLSVGLLIIMFITNYLLTRDIIQYIEAVFRAQKKMELFSLGLQSSICAEHLKFSTITMSEKDANKYIQLSDEFINNMTLTIETISSPNNIVTEGISAIDEAYQRYFLSDLCEILQQFDISFNINEEYNSGQCRLILQKILERGSKALSIVLIELQNTRNQIFKTNGITEETLKKFLLSSEDYMKTNLAIKLLFYLDKRIMEDLDSFTKTQISDYKRDLVYWLITVLLLIVIFILFYWPLLTNALSKIYFDSFDLLSHFPSRMIFTNKVLYFKIIAIIRKKK